MKKNQKADFSQKFHRLVPGLVGLIDAKGIDGREAVWHKGKNRQKLPKDQITQGPICEIFMKKFRELAILKNGNFEKFAILNLFCFILMKISPNLYGRMNGSKFWPFPLSAAKS